LASQVGNLGGFGAITPCWRINDVVVVCHPHGKHCCNSNAIVNAVMLHIDDAWSRVDVVLIVLVALTLMLVAMVISWGVSKV
jgi:hypothetical protein